MMLPNLILMGAQKAGTTSLHEYLSYHPEIFSVSELKDRDFFSHPVRRTDPGLYMAKYMDGFKNEKWILHTHVNYLIYKQAVRNIKKFCPSDIKLLVILRAPTDRAISAFNYFKKLRREQRSIEDALCYPPQEIHDFSFENNDFTYLEHGFYSEQLDVISQSFDSNDLLLLDFDQLKNDPKFLFDRVSAFLNIDSNHNFELKNRNVTGQVRSEIIQDILSTGKILRFLKPVIQRYTTLDVRKRIKGRLTELNTSKKKYSPELPDKQLRLKLENLFADDVHRLVKDYGFEAARKWPEFAQGRGSS